jgi:hypothetical protein
MYFLRKIFGEPKEEPIKWEKKVALVGPVSSLLDHIEKFLKGLPICRDYSTKKLAYEYREDVFSSGVGLKYIKVRM